MRDLDSLLDAIAAASSLTALFERFEHELCEVGCHAFTLGIAPLYRGKVDAAGAHLHSTLPAEFQARYHALRAQSFDPIFELMAERYLPFTKSSTEALFERSPQKRQIRTIAETHDLGDALMVPVPTADYSRGVVMFTRDRIDPRASGLWRQRHRLHLLAIQVMARAEALGFGPRATPAAALTEREVECLQLSAQGHTGEHIAQALGITERTVRFHIANANRKLGTARRSEAVARALREGLIRL